jgi:hypothetical protein
MTRQRAAIASKDASDGSAQLDFGRLEAAQHALPESDER